VDLKRDLDGISVYPNPTSGEVFIKGLRGNPIVKVTDLHGKVVEMYKTNQIREGRISLEDQPSGIYLIIVYSDNYHLKTIKVLKQ
jgi:hypothetical protein